MKQYFLTLAGLRTVLRTPYEISISENLRPFLCRGHQETDCVIQLQSCAALPAFSENGVWYGLEYYDSTGDAMRIFHCKASEAEAFAVTQLYKKGNIKIDILQDALSYFLGTSGIFNRIGMETLLLQHNGLLLHASLIKYKNRAIVFSGPSGVGKSTHADIWQKCLGAEVINGDRAALRKEDNCWMAYGSPYAGTSGIYKNDCAPLAGIVLLQQSSENCLRRLTPTQALRLIYPELTIHHWEKPFVAKATDLCLQLLDEIPVYMLQCRPEEDAALLVKKGLGL